MYFKKSLIICFAILFTSIFPIKVVEAKEFDGDNLRVFSSSRVFEFGCVCIKGLEPGGATLSSYLCGSAPSSGCDIRKELGGDHVESNEQKCYGFSGKLLIIKEGNAKVVDYKTNSSNCSEGQLNMLN